MIFPETPAERSLLGTVLIVIASLGKDLRDLWQARQRDFITHLAASPETVWDRTNYYHHHSHLVGEIYTKYFEWAEYFSQEIQLPFSKVTLAHSGWRSTEGTETDTEEEVDYDDYFFEPAGKDTGFTEWGEPTPRILPQHKLPSPHKVSIVSPEYWQELRICFNAIGSDMRLVLEPGRDDIASHMLLSLAIKRTDRIFKELRRSINPLRGSGGCPHISFHSASAENGKCVALSLDLFLNTLGIRSRRLNIGYGSCSGTNDNVFASSDEAAQYTSTIIRSLTEMMEVLSPAGGVPAPKPSRSSSRESKEKAQAKCWRMLARLLEAKTKQIESEEAKTQYTGGPDVAMQLSATAALVQALAKEDSVVIIVANALVLKCPGIPLIIEEISESEKAALWKNPLARRNPPEVLRLLEEFRNKQAIVDIS